MGMEMSKEGKLITSYFLRISPGMVCAMHFTSRWPGGTDTCSWDEVPASLSRKQILASRSSSLLTGKVAHSKAVAGEHFEHKINDRMDSFTLNKT